ncbi:MAG: hypothetical protein E4H09_01875 [Spirochaetales bacterium]|nr:MAG: hypothetical protein E4H09_01875 [Spirochaetales bacterium]
MASDAQGIHRFGVPANRPRLGPGGHSPFAAVYSSLMNTFHRHGLALILALTVVLTWSCATPADWPGGPFSVPDGERALTFSIASDMREFAGEDRRYFRGVAERLAAGGPGAFMISVGDIDPPDVVYQTLTTYVDPDYGWIPVVGNHEAETPADMEWLRAYSIADIPELSNIVAGPPGGEQTTFSFDAGGIHFVVLNEYYDGLTDNDMDPGGEVSDALHDWLVADLAAATAATILVFGHEPAYVLPDKDTGRIRHLGDSLDLNPANRDRFWQTLEDYGVTAYICGHTHNYSIQKFGSVWHIDSGHSRGYQDTGAPSAFLMAYVMADGSVILRTYRLNYDVGRYTLRETIQL